MKKHRRPSEPLPEVAEFLRSLQANLKSGGAVREDGLWFWRRDEGSLFLDPDETTAYSQLVTALIEKHVPREDLSRRSVESFLLDAVFAALDLGGSRSSTPPDERVRTAVAALLERLQAPSESFRCWLPIEGLKLDRRHARFAGARFVNFDRRQVAEMRRRNPSARSSSDWSPLLKHVRESSTWNHVCAVVDVKARDWASAETRAVHEGRRILDLLNVFTDLVPYNHGWLYLPGETAEAERVLPMQQHNGDISAPHTALDPLTAMSWKALKETKDIARPLRSLDRLARSPRRAKSCAAILVTAAQWIGRATVERRREQGFLLYAIALETLLVPAHSAELTYRLQLRAGRLLGKTPAARKRIAQQTADLYDVRSKIVHAGSYEVADEDLGRLRSFVKGALFRLLLMPKLHALTNKELSVWLDRELLR